MSGSRRHRAMEPREAAGAVDDGVEFQLWMAEQQRPQPPTSTAMHCSRSAWTTTCHRRSRCDWNAILYAAVTTSVRV